ncbi:MAG: PH domain-containing protein [Acidobacteriota bacterium]
MFEAGKTWLLKVLHVPAEPDPPAGDAKSLYTFRAAPNYFRYRLVTWGIGQIFILLTIGLLFIGAAAAAVKDGGQPGGILLSATLVLTAGALLLGALVSLFSLRLDYDMRWYLVTDQSLRIREGVFKVREMTMTFANVQNISIRQGPLQRLLGVADLEVQSAGGGGGGGGGNPQQGPGSLQMHTGYFRGVDNAEELRDLMRERLRLARGTGLGDPDDVGTAAAPESPPPTALGPVLEEMRAEAEALRRAAEAL